VHLQPNLDGQTISGRVIPVSFWEGKLFRTGGSCWQSMAALLSFRASSTLSDDLDMDMMEVDAWIISRYRSLRFHSVPQNYVLPP
jgi:hypothetical protein